MIGILLFLGINFLCFLPTYILNYKNQKQILPFFLFSKTRLKDNLRILFLWKNSSDFFRINFDFSILFLLTLYFDTPPLLLEIITLLLDGSFKPTALKCVFKLGVDVQKLEGHN